jgi:hypothetical protein
MPGAGPCPFRRRLSSARGRGAARLDGTRIARIMPVKVSANTTRRIWPLSFSLVSFHTSGCLRIQMVTYGFRWFGEITDDDSRCVDGVSLRWESAAYSSSDHRSRGRRRECRRYWEVDHLGRAAAGTRKGGSRKAALEKGASRDHRGHGSAPLHEPEPRRPVRR